MDGAAVLWVEGRPQNGGRQTLVRWMDGAASDVVSADFDVRSRVHEYGGRAFCAVNGAIWFSDNRDGRVHHIEGQGCTPVPITTNQRRRYADPCADLNRGRVLWVEEDHSGDGEAVNRIVALATHVPASVAGAAPDADATVRDVLVEGHDFVAAPRVSPDGALLAYVTWEHPDMPWDSTVLWVAALDGAGIPRDPRPIAGGPGESALEPVWAPDGSLWFASDAGTGWWNPHRWDGVSVRRVVQMEAETAAPAWVLGMQHIAPLDDGRAAVVARAAGGARLLVVDGDGQVSHIPLPHTDLGGVMVADGRGGVVLSGAGPDRHAELIRVALDSGEVTVLCRSSAADVDPAYLPVPEPISFPSADGRTAHAVLWRPRNPDCQPPDGEQPPLRILSHGGPTAAASAALSWDVAYFTSRGFAVLDVNYAGSTGYGRTYREALNGRWGIADVEDCLAGALAVTGLGIADPRRVCIQGGSAGGFTTLRALTTEVGGQVLAAGCSLFGVCDLALLAATTHKFESRYLDRLVGPLPAAADLYRERSPLHHLDQLRTPVVLFQGADDMVVPADQSRRFHAAARERGVTCAYEEFAGEQHGFRSAENIRRAIDGELAFYGQVLGFDPAEPLDRPLHIDNAPTP